MLDSCWLMADSEVFAFKLTDKAVMRRVGLYDSPPSRKSWCRTPAELPSGNAQAAEMRAVRGQMWLLDLMLATL